MSQRVLPDLPLDRMRRALVDLRHQPIKCPRRRLHDPGAGQNLEGDPDMGNRTTTPDRARRGSDDRVLQLEERIGRLELELLQMQVIFSALGSVACKQSQGLPV